MKYHNITVNDMKNGDGLRVVLWVAGCNHYCSKCHNPVTWDPDDGLEFNEDTKNELFKYLQLPHISGITFSGGDPLFPNNRIDILDIVSDIKTKFPNKSIWMYTGYTWEELTNKSTTNTPLLYEISSDEVLSILKNIDVLVDGRFESELQDVNYPWAGSTNQRVIDTKRSLTEGSLVLYESR